MHRFFSNQIQDDLAFFSDTDQHHIAHVLRLKSGEKITVVAKNQMEYLCELCYMDKKPYAHIQNVSLSQNEPNLSMTVLQCLPKGDKLDYIVQKCVELGVTTIIPVVSTHCVVKTDRAGFEKKRTRLNKIAHEAAKQSMRAHIPEVRKLITLPQALKTFSTYDKVFFFYEKAKERLKQTDLCAKESCAVLIGPEGGFSPAEAEQIQSSGALMRTLGPRILRTETAPITAVSILMYLSENI